MISRMVRAAAKQNLKLGIGLLFLLCLSVNAFAASETMGGPQLPGVGNLCYGPSCPTVLVCSPAGATVGTNTPPNQMGGVTYVPSTLACAQPAPPAAAPSAGGGMPPMPGMGGGGGGQQKSQDNSSSSSSSSGGSGGGDSSSGGPLTPASGNLDNSNNNMTPQVQKLLDAAIQVKGKPSGGLCGVGVRQAFEKAYGASVQRTSMARDYGPSYEKPPFNYKKCAAGVYTEFNAPAGSIVIYINSFRPSAAGHIEIKGLDGYYSDFFEAQPISVKGTRKVKEILVPPGDSKC